MKPSQGKLRTWPTAPFPKLPFTQTPDVLFDDIMVELSHPELLCLLYIIRHTFGYQKDGGDTITIDQFCNGMTKEGKQVDRGTGLHARTVYAALATLEKRGLIVRSRRHRHDGRQLPTFYALNQADETTPLPCTNDSLIGCVNDSLVSRIGCAKDSLVGCSTEHPQYTVRNQYTESSSAACSLRVDTTPDPNPAPPPPITNPVEANPGVLNDVALPAVVLTDKEKRAAHDRVNRAFQGKPVDQPDPEVFRELYAFFGNEVTARKIACQLPAEEVRLRLAWAAWRHEEITQQRIFFLAALKDTHQFELAEFTSLPAEERGSAKERRLAKEKRVAAAQGPAPDYYQPFVPEPARPFQKVSREQINRTYAAAGLRRPAPSRHTPDPANPS